MKCKLKAVFLPTNYLNNCLCLPDPLSIIGKMEEINIYIIISPPDFLELSCVSASTLESLMINGPRRDKTCLRGF